LRAHLIKRILTIVPVIFLVSLIVFLLLHLIPGDPALVYVGEDAEPGEIERIRFEMGLDRPLYVQFGTWFVKIIRGDFGESIIYQRPVIDLILERLPVTLSFGFFAMLISLMFAIPSGILAAVNHNTYKDYFFTFIAVLGISIPGFWLSLMFISTFSLKLGWLPATGYVPLTENFWGGVECLILPSTAHALLTAAIVARMLRSSMLEVLRQDFITTARGKGLPARWVIYKHALKNAFAPTLTIIGFQIGAVIGGSIIFETIFTLPGVGQMIYTAIGDRDYPVVQGCLLIIALSFVLVNLIVDLLYSYFDPRITYEK